MVWRAVSSGQGCERGRQFTTPPPAKIASAVARARPHSRSVRRYASGVHAGEAEVVLQAPTSEAVAAAEVVLAVRRGW